MDRAGVIEHCVFIRVIGRAFRHERGDKGALPAEAWAGKQQGPRAERDDAGMHEDVLAREGSDPEAKLRVEHVHGDVGRESAAKRRAVHQHAVGAFCSAA